VPRASSRQRRLSECRPAALTITLCNAPPTSVCPSSLSHSHLCRLATQRSAVTTLRAEVATLRASLEAEQHASKDGFAHKIADAKASWDRHHREKLEELERKLRAEFEKEAKELKAREKQLRETTDRIRADLGKVTLELSQQQVFANDLLKQIASQESAHEADKFDWETARADYETRLARAQKGLADKTDDFNKLMDVKITLQAEINHYRCALEEDRVPL